MGESARPHTIVPIASAEGRNMARAATKAASQVDEEAPEGDEGTKPAKQQIREAFGAGKTRREIADEFGLSYQRVYQVTKDMEGASQARTRVIVEDSEAIQKAGRQDLIGMPRVEAIRLLYGEGPDAGGMKVGDIARLLDCSYQVAFQATRSQRAGADGADEDADVEDELEDDDELDEDEEEEDEDE